jgi:RNA polymerase sigma factor (sigma-70 family)
VTVGPTDADLVLLLRRRRPGAFDEVFRRYRDRIWRFLVNLTRQPDRAEDLFQETWLAAARNAHRLSEDTDLGPWLFTIARNKHRNGLRFLANDQRKRQGLAAVPPAATASPDEATDARRAAARVASGLARLPVAHREVLLLSVQEGMETREIAAVLGLREEAVRKRLSRARAELARSSGLGDGADSAGDPAQIEAEQRRREASR